MLRRFGGESPQPTGVDPTALDLRAARSRRGDPLAARHLVRRLRLLPVDIVGKTGSAEKLVTLPGYSTPQNLTQSWWCGYGPYDGAVDRRLRRDRERRPRRHGRRAGRAEGVRAVLPYVGHDHEPRVRLMAIEAVDTRARGLRTRREVGGTGLRRPPAAARLAAARGARRDRRRMGSGRSTGSRCTMPAGSAVDAAGGLRLRRRPAVRRRAARRPRPVPAAARPIYFGTLAVMIFVLVAGAATRGSRRWIDVGFFTFQPSEFGKVVFVARARRLRRRALAVAARARDAARDRSRYGLGADRARLPAARHRHRARLHGGARRRPLRRGRPLAASRRARRHRASFAALASSGCCRRRA